MSLLKQTKALIQKDIVLEWRSKAAINGILLYVVSTVFVCYQAFKSVDTLIWNALFWIIMLFAATNAINKSFTQENTNRLLYYYSLVSAKAIILAKIIYNMALMALLSTLAIIIYTAIFPNPVGDPILFYIAVLLGSISFSSIFTMVAGITAKAGNNSTLMAILSFPAVVPLLIVLIRLTQNAINGMSRSESINEIAVLLAINIITITISLLLFPYLWRD